MKEAKAGSAVRATQTADIVAWRGKGACAPDGFSEPTGAGGRRSDLRFGAQGLRIVRVRRCCGSHARPVLGR